MGVGCGCWSSTSRARGQHQPEVLGLCTCVSHGRMELGRGELHPQGALGWRDSLEPPPSPSAARAEGHGALCCPSVALQRGTCGDKVSQEQHGEKQCCWYPAALPGIRHILASTGTACGGFGCPCCHLLCHLWCSSAE